MRTSRSSITLTLGTMAWCDTPSSALSQKCPDLPRDALDAAGQQRPGCRAGQRQVEDLVGLLPGDGGLVEWLQLAVGFELVEGLAQRPGVLSGEQGALDGAPIAQVLQDFLADQLSLAIAVENLGVRAAEAGRALPHPARTRGATSPPS